MPTSTRFSKVHTDDCDCLVSSVPRPTFHANCWVLQPSPVQPAIHLALVYISRNRSLVWLTPNNPYQTHPQALVPMHANIDIGSILGWSLLYPNQTLIYAYGCVAA